MPRTPYIIMIVTEYMDTVLAATSDNFAIPKVSAVEFLQGNVAVLYYDMDRIHVATCLILRPNFS